MCHASCWKPNRDMKEKTDVRQGTLALMVLKTLDVLGPLHGYGIARRIEQISGDLLTVNQGTLYPVLLKLEQEGSIASEWGASENNRKARFYRLTRDGRKQLQAETRGWEQTAAIIGRFFAVKARGSEMRALRRFFRRLSSWATTRRDEERLRAEIEEHLDLQTAENVRAGLSPVEARRQAVLKFGAVEAMKESYRDQRGLPFLETLVQDTRHALRRLRMAPAFTDRHGADAGAGHWRDHVDFHAGACRSAEVAAGRESRRIVPAGKRIALLLLGRVQPGQRVLPRLVRSVQVLARQHQGLFRIGGLSVVQATRSASARSGGSETRPKAIRASSSPAITSRCSAFSRMPAARSPRGRSARRSAGGGDELSLVAAEVRIGSVRHRQRLQSERQAIHGRGNHSAGFLRRHAAQHSARFLSAAEHRTVRRERMPISTSTTPTGWS